MVVFWIILAVSALVITTGTYFAHQAGVFDTESDAQAFPITLNGEIRNLFIQPTDWSKKVTVLEDDPDSVEYAFNQRMYLQNGDKNDPDDYFTVNLLGGWLEYDVDLSEVGCNCIAALYGVRMPAQDENATGQKYCDAQGEGGSYCPEFDMFEGNLYGFHTTAHACEVGEPFSADTCNHGGQCTVDAYYGGTMDGSPQLSNYGIGATYRIDSSKPFTVRHNFIEDDDGNFGSYDTILSQGAETMQLNATGCSDADALLKMTDDMKNMVIVFSSWEQSANWLQHGTCDKDIPCANTETFKQAISNVKITTKPISM